PGRGHGRAYGRVHVAVGQPGRPQRHADGLGQQRADAVPAASERPDLGVFPEAATGGVHRGEVVFEQAAGPGQGGRGGDHQLHQGAEGAPGGGRFGVRGGGWHYEPPEVAWLPPELELGEEPELKPPELDPEFVDPESAEPESAEPELAELEPTELELEE